MNSSLDNHRPLKIPKKDLQKKFSVLLQMSMIINACRGERIAGDMARGLAFLHSQQIVHVSTWALASAHSHPL